MASPPATRQSPVDLRAGATRWWRAERSASSTSSSAPTRRATRRQRAGAGDRPGSPASRSARRSCRPDRVRVGPVERRRRVCARASRWPVPASAPWRSRSRCARATVPSSSRDASRRSCDAVAFAGAEVEAEVLVVDNASDDDRAGADGAGARRRRASGSRCPGSTSPATVPSRESRRRSWRSSTTTSSSTRRGCARWRGRSRPTRTAVAVTGGVTAFSARHAGPGQFERCGGFFKGWRAGPLERPRPTGPAVRSRRSVSAATWRSGAPRSTADRAVRRSAGHGPAARRRRRPRHARAHGHGTVRCVYEPSAMVRHEHRAHVRRAAPPVPLVGQVLGRRAAQVVPHARPAIAG